MHHRMHVVTFVIAFAFSLFCPVSTAPSTPFGSVSKPITTQIVQTTQTRGGPVTETCNVTLTPVTGPNGEHLVQVVRQCTVSGGSGSNAPPPPANSAPPAVTISSSPTLSAAVAGSSGSASSANPGVSVNGFSSITVSSVSPPSSQTSTTSTKPKAATSTPTPPATSTSGTSPASGADNASSSTSSATQAAAFQIPGKKISVLPIGLGIFAGISVIALIVVGLVTYERTKYRKIFRQRKLAEQGADMGYN
ncbi:hypothetical protein BGW80DRAFT_1280886 [Lactifluus volemus]|nr:hypothetical protein BGW80DRAFT_1280886 [Lactifluus volemus]